MPRVFFRVGRQQIERGEMHGGPWQASWRVLHGASDHWDSNHRDACADDALGDEAFFVRHLSFLSFILAQNPASPARKGAAGEAGTTTPLCSRTLTWSANT